MPKCCLGCRLPQTPCFNPPSLSALHICSTCLLSLQEEQEPLSWPCFLFLVLTPSTNILGRANRAMVTVQKDGSRRTCAASQFNEVASSAHTPRTDPPADLRTTENPGANFLRHPSASPAEDEKPEVVAARQYPSIHNPKLELEYNVEPHLHAAAYFHPVKMCSPGQRELRSEFESLFRRRFYSSIDDWAPLWALKIEWTYYRVSKKPTN